MGIGDEERKQVLVIGDSLNSDIQGGKNAGLDTCWYCPAGFNDELPDYVVHSYEELMKLLGV